MADWFTICERRSIGSKRRASKTARNPQSFAQFDGILVPGGFGKRGIPGMIRAIQFAREEKVPYFGICLGMQCAVIEYALNVCGLKGANSTEFDSNTPYPVIYKLRDLLGIDTIGGTMRLGAYPADLESRAHSPIAFTNRR